MKVSEEDAEILIEIIARNIALLNNYSDFLCNFEEKVSMVGGSVTPKTAKKINNMCEDTEVAIGIFDKYGISYSLEVEEEAGYLNID